MAGLQQFEAAVEVLAELSSAAAGDARPVVAIPLEWFRWVPPCEELFAATVVASSRADAVARLAGMSRDGASVTIERGYADRLAGVDQVRAAPHSVRLGWLFVAGSVHDGGRTRRVFHPLVSIAVRVIRPPLTASGYVVAAGDVDVSPLIPRQDRGRFELAVEFGGGAFAGSQGVAVSPKLLARLPRLNRFAMEAAKAAGLPADRIVPVHASAAELMQQPGLTVIAGYGLYVNEDSHDVSRTEGNPLSGPGAMRLLAG